MVIFQLWPFILVNPYFLNGHSCTMFQYNAGPRRVRSIPMWFPFTSAVFSQRWMRSAPLRDGSRDETGEAPLLYIILYIYVI